MNIELNIKDVNIILAALGKAPYEVVFETIHKIQDQAKEQAEAR